MALYPLCLCKGWCCHASNSCRCVSRWDWSRGSRERPFHFVEYSSAPRGCCYARAQSYSVNLSVSRRDHLLGRARWMAGWRALQARARSSIYSCCSPQAPAVGSFGGRVATPFNWRDQQQRWERGDKVRPGPRPPKSRLSEIRQKTRKAFRSGNGALAVGTGLYALERALRRSTAGRRAPSFTRASGGRDGGAGELGSQVGSARPLGTPRPATP